MDHLERMMALGFRFEPSAEELITYYLPRLIAGQPLDTMGIIHRADVYGSEPRDLAGQFPPLHKSEHGDRFFFSACKRQKGSSTRKARAAGKGVWVSQTSRPAKNSAGVKIGETKVFRFKNGGNAGKYTDWLMEEHHSCLQEATAAGDEEPVICKIYVSPRAPKDSAARQESAAFLRQEPAPPLRPAPAPEFVPRNEPTKRPAPPVADPPCAKKMRGDVPARPPVPTAPEMHQVAPARSSAVEAPPPAPAAAEDFIGAVEETQTKECDDFNDINWDQFACLLPLLEEGPEPPVCIRSVAEAATRQVAAAGSSTVEAPPAAPAAAEDFIGTEEETETADEVFARWLEEVMGQEEDNNEKAEEALDEPAGPAPAVCDGGDNEMYQMDGTLLSQSEEAENDDKLQEPALGVPAGIDGGGGDLDQFASPLDDFLRSSEVRCESNLADIADWFDKLPDPNNNTSGDQDYLSVPLSEYEDKLPPY